MHVTDEQFQALFAAVNKLRNQLAGNQDQAQRQQEAEQERAEAEQAAQEEARHTAQEIQNKVRQIATDTFRLPLSTSDQFAYPENDAPPARTNPFPRPQGIAKCNAAFQISQTTYRQQWASQLGAKSGYYCELEAWLPIISALWDTTSAITGVLAATDTPAAVLLTLGNRGLELKSILDSALRIIHVHELRAQRGAQIADAYVTHLSLASRGASYLPADVSEFDRSVAKRLQEQATKQAAQQHRSVPLL